MFRLMKYSIGKSHNEPFPGKSYGWRMAVSGAVDGGDDIAGNANDYPHRDVRSKRLKLRIAGCFR